MFAVQLTINAFEAAMVSWADRSSEISSSRWSRDQKEEGHFFAAVSR
jgi:hypothetical protein